MTDSRSSQSCEVPGLVGDFDFSSQCMYILSILNFQASVYGITWLSLESKMVESISIRQKTPEESPGLSGFKSTVSVRWRASEDIRDSADGKWRLLALSHWSLWFHCAALSDRPVDVEQGCPCRGGMSSGHSGKIGLAFVVGFCKMLGLRWYDWQRLLMRTTFRQLSKSRIKSFCWLPTVQTGALLQRLATLAGGEVWSYG